MHRGRSDTAANANAILTRAENSLAKFSHQISDKQLLEVSVVKEFANESEGFCE